MSIAAQRLKWQSPLGLVAVGCLMLWAAMPPLGWAALAWFAPLPWLLLIQKPGPLGKRSYWAIWGCGLVYWLVTLEGIRLAHPILYLGWFALSAYLAAYLPLFIALNRWVISRVGISLVVAAPVIWTGLEMARGVLFTGFSMALLGHSQYQQPQWIQVADWGGAYAVSFLLMLVAACLARMLWPLLTESVESAGQRTQSSRTPPLGRWQRWWPALVMGAALGGSWRYGDQRLERTKEPDKSLKVALIQNCFNTQFAPDPARNREIFLRYIEQSRRVAQQHPDLDLIVWPESVYSGNVPEFLIEGETPGDRDPQRLREVMDEFAARAVAVARAVNDPTATGRTAGKTHLLVGTTTVVLAEDQQKHFNSALLLDPSGQVIDRYYKMHRVMFGEYIPLLDYFPGLYKLTPLSGLTAGKSAAVFEVQGVRLSPSICFESAVPHLIRRQFADLSQAGERPDLLVNLTHDGWFWGSAILDLQLAGAVFRAVELRTPCIVAANAGISAWIDDRGQIRAEGPRQGHVELVADVETRGRTTLYARFGDWFAGGCLLATALALCGWLWGAFNRNRQPL